MEEQKEPVENKEFEKFFKDKVITTRLHAIKETFNRLGVKDPTKPETIIPLKKFEQFNYAWREFMMFVFWRSLGDNYTDEMSNDNLLLLDFLMTETLNMHLQKEDDHVVMKALDGRTMGWGELTNKDLWFCK